LTSLFRELAAEAARVIARLGRERYRLQQARRSVDPENHGSNDELEKLVSSFVREGLVGFVPLTRACELSPPGDG
jgi:hypothetical protein